jgi:hypothetical protein
MSTRWPRTRVGDNANARCVRNWIARRQPCWACVSANLESSANLLRRKFEIPPTHDSQGATHCRPWCARRPRLKLLPPDVKAKPSQRASADVSRRVKAVGRPRKHLLSAPQRLVTRPFRVITRTRTARKPRLSDGIATDAHGRASHPPYHAGQLSIEGDRIPKRGPTNLNVMYEMAGRRTSRSERMSHISATQVRPSACNPLVSEGDIRTSTAYELAHVAKPFGRLKIRRCVRKDGHRGVVHLIGHSPRFPIAGPLFGRKSRSNRPLLSRSRRAKAKWGMFGQAMHHPTGRRTTPPSQLSVAYLKRVLQPFIVTQRPT